jgi:hypothetical protein
MEKVPLSFVATSTQSGDQVDGVKELKRKFEDNEAVIITDLYHKHFRPKSELSGAQNTQSDDNTQKNLSDFQNSVDKFQIAP